MEPIRVLCVFSSLETGGAESMCMNLYRAIDRSRIQFDFVKHTHEKGAFEDEITSLGGRIFEAPRFKIYNYFSYRAWWMRHLKAHPEHRIIHGHFFTISSVYFGFAKKLGRKTVGHIHASCEYKGLKKYFVNKIAKTADYRIACSRQSGERYYHGSPFFVLNNALDTDKFAYNENVRNAVREKLKLGDSYVLGTVANFSAVKNPFGLIEIFKSVKALRADAKLVWVGEGSLRSEIEEKIKSEGLEGSVLLLGRRNDVHELLQAMDAFLLPSFSEGLPLSVIEAQASGLPCFLSEGVTKDVDVTGMCRFIPLSDTGKWAHEIYGAQPCSRITKEKISAAGYDVHTTAAWIENFYSEMIEG